MGRRVILIVLDSVGIGAMPDADRFGDAGANTLKSVASSAEFHVPNMRKLGLFNIDGVSCGDPIASPMASFARLSERSLGKDTTVGHWEIAGISSPNALPTYPNGFPADILQAFEKKVGRQTVCNKPYSGTEVIADYGEHHMKTGDLIIYTSADSVFQIAANESVVPLDELYLICQTARDMLTLETGHPVGRVIARPFVGTNRDNFQRTSNRHDYSLAPPQKTMLDYVLQAGQLTIGVGKIYDIFSGQGIAESFKTQDNNAGMRVTLELMQRDFTGLLFVNLVDFDMIYGHRNNVDGYAAALTAFDKQLGDLMPLLRPEDLLMITADHGCDPGYTQTTDHTREYIPLLMYGEHIAAGKNYGTRETFADIGATVCSWLKVESSIEGTPIEV